MPDGYRVDTSLLRSAVTGIDAAARELEDGRGVLESVRNRLDSGDVLDQGTGADDKINTFVRQWREELKLFKEMLEGIRGALLGAADSYDQIDCALADQMLESTGGAPGG